MMDSTVASPPGLLFVYRTNRKLTTSAANEVSEVIPWAFTAKVPPTEKEQYDCIVLGALPKGSKYRKISAQRHPVPTVIVSS